MSSLLSLYRQQHPFTDEGPDPAIDLSMADIIADQMNRSPGLNRPIIVEMERQLREKHDYICWLEAQLEEKNAR